jgi:hypothetical protein
VSESRLKRSPPADPYDWKQYVDPNDSEQVDDRGKIIQNKAMQWEQKARMKEQMIKQSKREENINEIKEINGHLVGAIKAKLSIIDSFEL